MEQPLPKNAVGVTIRQLRYKRGWTQEALAAKCEVAGCALSRGTLAKIEAQIRSVTDVEIFAIAGALQVPIPTLYPKDFSRQLRASGWAR
jgi:transcriptional regulator with XRE-family HTH domain